MKLDKNKKRAEPKPLVFDDKILPIKSYHAVPLTNQFEVPPVFTPADNRSENYNISDDLDNIDNLRR